MRWCLGSKTTRTMTPEYRYIRDPAGGRRADRRSAARRTGEPRALQWARREPSRVYISGERKERDGSAGKWSGAAGADVPGFGRERRGHCGLEAARQTEGGWENKTRELNLIK